MYKYKIKIRIIKMSTILKIKCLLIKEILLSEIMKSSVNYIQR